MSDQFTEVETTGYFQRIMNSLGGVVFGILLFLASFVLLYWNEGRVDLSQVAKTAIEIPALEPPPAEIGSFVSVTGTLTSEEPLGDDLFLVPGDYIALKRQSEIYAWEEDSKTTTHKNLGGSETKRTTYTYRKSWKEDPENSSSFKEPQGHQNPPKKISSTLFQVSLAQIGQYRFDLQSLHFPTPSPVSLNASNFQTHSQYPEVTQSGEYLFVGDGALQAPQIGDIRIRYQALNKGIQATILGSLSSSNTISSYLGPRGLSIYRLFPGDQAQAISTLSKEHTMLTWGLRGGGFLIMWIGMNLIIGPLNVLLDIIPIVGTLTGSATKGVTLIAALVLSSLTILISIVFHNPIMIFMAVGFSGFALFWWWNKRSRQRIRS